MNQARYRLALACVLAALPLGWSSVAAGKREFPSQIEHDVPPTTAYQVPCSVCHIKGNTGSSTAITPLALSLRARGLSGSSDSLTTALAQLEIDGTDSDGDKISDIDELKNGTDPNSSANASIINDQEPGYGCGGTAPTGKGGPGAASLLTLGWLILRRRRGQS